MSDRLDEIEARLTRNAVPDPHPESHDCRECSDARDIAALVKFAREVEALHQKVSDVDSRGKPYATCSICLNGYAEPRDWPCPTAAALERMGGA